MNVQVPPANTARYCRLAALLFVLVAVVLSPLLVRAATVPTLITYDVVGRAATTTVLNRRDTVRPDAERPWTTNYDDAHVEYDDASNPPVGARTRAVHACDRALELTAGREVHGEGAIYATPAPTTAAESAPAAARTFESFLPQAKQRVAQAYETHGGRSGVEATARFNEDQAALIDLAKMGQRTGLSPGEADTMMQWAQEYGVPFRNDIGKMHRVGGDHIHIGPVNHIPVGP